MDGEYSLIALGGLLVLVALQIWFNTRDKDDDDFDEGV